MSATFPRGWRAALPTLASHPHLIASLVVAWLLVIGRSAVYVLYEHAFFDSDQAIFGLMAKHLIEGRAFPLFCYGQTYMLAVDSWLAVPFFLVAGPTVGALHASLLFSNLVVVTVVLTALHLHAKLRPLMALAAVVPLAFVPPDTTADLLEAAGNVGPLLYVPLLWLLVDRPLWFGLVLGLGTLHREFTVYAVPVLLIQQAWTGSLWRVSRIQGWLVAAVATVATWQTVEALRPFSDAMGPGTRGTEINASAGVGAVMDRIEFVAAELPERLSTMVLQHMPGLMGGRVRRVVTVQGHDWLFWPLMAILALGVVVGVIALLGDRWRAVRLRTTSPAARASSDLPLFLFGVGLVAMIGYIVTRPADFFQDRYMLLALYLPVGAASLVFTVGPRWTRAVVVGCILLLAGGSAVDHVRQFERYRAGREPNDLRVLADALVARGQTVAQSGYWRAYKLTFLTQERVKVASTDVVRIEEYQRLAREAGNGLVTIQADPCPGGERIGGHYVCGAGR